ncbi:RidA family protein [Nocardia asiatica]|uniref:RidA family protein n=1 Tax=Nocardia asiatica TaxID=209252 RepID=UPI003EE3EBCF
MTVEHFTPEGMSQPTPYHHVAVGTGSRQVHVSGQVARLADGTSVAPGDLAGQVAQALRNTGSTGRWRRSSGSDSGARCVEVCIEDDDVELGPDRDACSMKEYHIEQHKSCHREDQVGEPLL